MSINPVGGSFLSLFEGADEPRVAVPVVLSNRYAGPEEDAAALLSSLGFNEADLAAYKEQHGVDLRQTLTAQFAANRRAGRVKYEVGHRFYDHATKSYKWQTRIGINESSYRNLTGFIAERRTQARQANVGSGAETRAGQELNAYGLNKRGELEAKAPLAEVTVMGTAAAIPIETTAPPVLNLPSATAVKTAVTAAAPVIAEAALPAAAVLAEFGAGAIVANHLAQKYVEGKTAHEMALAEQAYRTLELQNAPPAPITANPTDTRTKPDFGIPTADELPRGEVVKGTPTTLAPPPGGPGGEPPKLDPRKIVPPIIAAAAGAGGGLLAERTLRPEAVQLLSPAEQEGIAGLAAYREQWGLPEFKVTPGETGTVAQLEVNGQKVSGLNTTLERKHFGADNRALREQALADIQTRLGKLGGNKYGDWDVRFLTHAEADALINANRQFGPLPERVTLYVDRASCDNCLKNLPLLAELYGIKELTVVNSNGKRFLVRPGEATVEITRNP